MRKVLLIDYEKCNGCGDCELACAVHHEGVSNPARSRIRVIKSDREEVYAPVTCQQCESAPCLLACPVQAIFREPELYRVMVDQNKCIGCKTCVTVCPFGAMAFNGLTQQVMKCDLCDGDPQCVPVCEPGAILYAEADEVSIGKQVVIAGKYVTFARAAAGLQTGGNTPEDGSN